MLDIGTGTGVVALALRRRGYPVVGVDASAAMLARARDRLPGSVVLADAGALPFPTSSFGRAVAVWVLHAVAHPGAVFLEAARVLGPRGRLLVCSRSIAPQPTTGSAEPSNRWDTRSTA